MKNQKNQIFLRSALLACCVVGLSLIAAALLRGGIPRILYDHHLSRQTVETHYLEGPFYLELDLKDPESNVGKVLYQDDACRITVDCVPRVDTASDPYYYLQLVCRPKITLGGVHLIVPHSDTVQEPPLILNQGETYRSQLQGAGPMGPDGWYFGYYLFLSDPEQQDDSGNLAPSEPDSVTFIFPGLEDCLWSTTV